MLKSQFPLDKKRVYNITVEEVNELLVVAKLKGKTLVVESQNRPDCPLCITSHINGNVFSAHTIYSSTRNDDAMVWVGDIKCYYMI